MLSSRRIIIGHFMAIYKIQVWVEAQMSQFYTGTWTQVTFMCTGSFLKENDPIHEAELNKSCVNHHQQNWNTCSPQMSHTSLHTLVYMLCIFNTSEAISLHPATSSCSFREATQVRLGWTCVVASVLQDETHWIPCLCQPQSSWSRQAVWGPNSATQNQIHSPTASTSHPGEEAHWHSNCTVKVLQ